MWIRARTCLLLTILLFGGLVLASCGATPTGTPGGGDGDGSGDDTGGGDTPGPALHNTIAYVPSDSGDEIRVIEPDGANDRRLWAHGRADPSEALNLWGLDWRPDAREIAFSGNHENDCSLLHNDIYAVGTDGGDYRRLSGPPACGALADYPTGTVRVPVSNDSFLGESVDIFLYFLGAPAAQQVSLPPGGTTTVTFENVADFGDGVVQYGMLIQADRRELAASAAADVQAGGTVTTAQQSVYTPESPGWEARSPTWRSDGSLVGYAYNFNTLYGQSPDPEPLSLGDELLSSDAMPNIVSRVVWNPVPELAGELLYVGWTFEANSIYLANEGGTDAGELLLSFESYEAVLGLDWLPDGNGFVFSLLQGAIGDSANLWIYSLETNTATRLTDFTSEFAGELSVSADGTEIVFERASTITDSTRDLIDPDLWILDDQGNLRLLRQNAGDPDWSSN